MFPRRRLRRLFRELVTDELTRVEVPVRESVSLADEELAATLSSLRQSSTAACPHCGGRMDLRPVKVRRNWWTLWVCATCGKMVRDADLPFENRPTGVRL